MPEERSGSNKLPNEPLTIGRVTPKRDAFTKVTGGEKFAADYYPDNYLIIGIKRSEYPHALIKAIDITAAKDLPGVVAVLTHREITGTNRLGILEKDQPVLADERVRHYGDAVALVLAESKILLEQALVSIKVTYEPLEAVFDPRLAQTSEAPLLYPDRPGGNTLFSSEIVSGQGGTGLTDCAYRAELEIALDGQEHAFLETETGVAWLEADGTVVITVSTQTPFRDRLELAEALGLPLARIRVIAPCLGGGFGGKDGVTVQGFLALAALHSEGRPVKIWYSREESFLAGTKRHPAILKYRLGCDQAGNLQALDCSILMDTGAFASLGIEVLALAMEHAGGPYRIPNAIVRGAVVYTNNPIFGAFRGFGVPQAAAGIEQAVDELARLMGRDPLQFRLQNVARQGDTIPTGVTLTQPFGLDEVLKRVADHPWWQERQAWQEHAPRFKRRGVGIAAVFHGMGFGPIVPDYANAKLELTEAGKILVYVGVAEMGQGNASTFLQITGHLLNQGFENLEMVLPDTSRTLPSASASASRTTFTYGNALLGAAQLLQERILARAALLLTFQLKEHVTPAALELIPGSVRHQATGRELPLAMIAGTMSEAERVVTNCYTCPVNTQQLSSGQDLRLHGFPHRIFACGVNLARVEIDSLTGETTVVDFLTAVEAGEVLNPQTFEQQVQGGAAQGLGYALFEEFGLAEGRMKNSDFTTYIIPTALDIPELETMNVPLRDEDGPFGMKGVGEISIDGVFPAVANAFTVAIGARITQGTMTAERVLATLERDREENRA